MLPLSVVILTLNEENNIKRCLQSIDQLADEVLIADSGSTDQTIAIAQQSKASLHQIKWQGYGATKNALNALTRYNWILSLDADEAPDATLIQSIHQLFQPEPPTGNVFSVQRRMVYCGRELRHGSVQHEYRIRLFNKHSARWNTDDVHEQLEIDAGVSVHKLNGLLWHYSYTSPEEHRQRLEKYACLSAHHLVKTGKRANFIKRFLSPAFSFIKNYIVRLGFLDGYYGWLFARNECWYVYRKYQLLHKRHQ